MQELVGLSLRACHYQEIENALPSIPFFEILADNYFSEKSLKRIEKIRAHYPLTLHCVGMSLGSTDPLNKIYLKKLKNLSDIIQPEMISDHLSWSSFGNRYFHDLLPLPYTEEAINHVVDRISQVQDFLQQPILIENVSSYLTFKDSHLTEWEFLQTVAEKADAFILLDINNIFVSASNLNFSPKKYLASLSPDRIKQFHLGGFENKTTHLLDTHGENIHADVWDLYQYAIQLYGPKTTVIERDNDIPAFNQLYSEVKNAKKILDSCYAK